MLLIHLVRLATLEGDGFPSPEKLSQYMAIDAAKVREVMASLMEKKFLSVVQEPEQSSGRRCYKYCWEDLMVHLAKLWLEEVEANAAEVGKTTVADLYTAFEQEFGRPLSPMEAAQLTEWCQRFPAELIYEALRLAVLRGVFNFRYIDTILHEWEKKNVRTLKEAQEYETRFRELRRKRRAKSGQDTGKEGWRDEKYKDLYLS
jgi:DNA replication protein